MSNTTKNRIERLYQAVYLRECAVCGDQLDTRGGCICGECRKLWENETAGIDGDFIPLKPLSTLTFLGAYVKNDASICRRLIIAQKEHDRPAVDEFFAECLADKLRDRLPFNAGETFVTSVPRSGANLLDFGFNQSERLAKRLSYRLGLEYCRSIRYVGRGVSQKSLNADQRRANADSSYAFDKRFIAETASRRCILVDDVYTTGATLSACARLLLEYGARCVDGAVVARAMSPVFSSEMPPKRSGGMDVYYDK